MTTNENDTFDPRNTSTEQRRRAKWSGVLARLRIPSLTRRYSQRPVWAVFVLINGFVTIALLASVAVASNTPFVFPSLGPTAILLFLNPLHSASSPRNALCGHAIGILCGYGALWVTGLAHESRVDMEGLEAARVVAAALSLAGTGAIMVLLNVSHPPAGATTLIIALGIITRPYHLLVIEIAVVALVMQALVINRLAGIPYPFWRRTD